MTLAHFEIRKADQVWDDIKYKNHQKHKSGQVQPRLIEDSGEHLKPNIRDSDENRSISVIVITAAKYYVQGWKKENAKQVFRVSK